MQPNQKNIRELYDRDGLRLVMYQHPNGAKTLRMFYDGKPNEASFSMAYRRAIKYFQSNPPNLEPNQTLENYLAQTENISYVNDLGSRGNGVILGAYVPSQDRIYLRKDMPKRAIDSIKQVLYSQKQNSHNLENRVKRFTKAHEVEHRKRRYEGKSQDESSVDLEAAVKVNDYPVLRSPQVHQEYLRRKAA